MPETKLTPAQIAEGWIEIESAETLNALWQPHHQLLDDCGVTWDAFNDKVGGYWLVNGLGTHKAYNLINTFIAYRPLPSYEECQQLRGIYDDYKMQTDDVIESLEAQLAAANNGKTIRDEIAIAAMPAISIHSSPDTIKKTARRAYDLADAMLEARKGGDTDAD